MNIIAVCFLTFLLGSAHGLINRYVYEFGQDYGDIISIIDGNIPILQTLTERYLSVPQSSTVTYLRVTVDAISPPKVDFNAEENLVTFMYSWTQISMSKVTVLMTAVLFFIIISLVFGFSYSSSDETKEIIIKSYIFGKKSNASVLSYIYVGVVPAYEPLYNFTVMPTGGGTLSHLRVQYWNAISDVDMKYNPQESLLTFFIKFPLISFPFGIDGYTTANPAKM